MSRPLRPRFRKQTRLMHRISRYYNLHDLVTIRLTSEWPRATQLVDQHYSSFKTASFEHPDIDVIVGAFEPDLKDYVVIDDKYYVKNDSLYCEDSHKVSHWKVWIQDLEGSTRIFFTGDPLFSYLFLFKFLLEPVVFFKLIRKGYSFLHSSCVGDGKRAYIFVASKGVGKTTSALRLAAEGMQFFSDEYTILSKDGTVYSYPNCIHLHAYNLKDLPFLRDNLRFKDLAMIRLKGNIYRLSLKYANLAHNLDIKEALPGITLGSSCPLGGIILLTRSTLDRPVVSKTDPGNLARRIVSITNFEMPQFVDYIAAFSAVDSRSVTASHWERFAGNLACLAQVPCYEIKMAAGGKEANWKAIKDLLAKLKNPETISP